MCFFTFALWWNIHAFYSHLHRSITIATRVCLMRLRENHKSFHGFNMQQITGNLPFEFNSTSFIIYPFCFSFKTNWLLKYPYFKISLSTKKQHTLSEIHSIWAFTNHMNARPKNIHMTFDFSTQRRVNFRRCVWFVSKNRCTTGDTLKS